MLKNFRRNRKIVQTFFLISTIFLFFTACNNKKEEIIQFDTTFPNALSPNTSWALVTDPYAGYKKDLDWDSEVTAHCRRGEILEVLGKNYDSENREWYKFEEGWLPETCIVIFSNRFKAENAAESLGD